jgi:ribonuclease PH
MSVQQVILKRSDGRAPNQMRPVKLHRGWIKFADGSCLIEVGNTRVVCTATITDKVPPFLAGSKTGWITAEYGMIPRSGVQRSERESKRGRPHERSVEIGRIIGRALRAAVDLSALGERTIIIDCDVLQSDGGTRTAAITGGFVALVEALHKMREQNLLQSKTLPLFGFLAAISVGIVDRVEMLDLNYEEDARSSVDMNVAMLEGGKFVEIQATAEGTPFTHEQLFRLLSLARAGIEKLFELQRDVLKDIV